MGAVRGWEEDVIFEGKCEMLGGTSEGLWLDEGVQRWVCRFETGLQYSYCILRLPADTEGRDFRLLILTGLRSRSFCLQRWLLKIGTTTERSITSSLLSSTV
jgi:hypothetical protein